VKLPYVQQQLKKLSFLKRMMRLKQTQWLVEYWEPSQISQTRSLSSEGMQQTWKHGNITNRFIKFQELQFCNLNYHLLYTGCFVLSQRISVLDRDLRCRGTITLQARFRPWPQWHITLTNAYFPLVHLIPKSMYVSHTFAQLISWATSATLGLCLTSISLPCLHTESFTHLFHTHIYCFAINLLSQYPACQIGCYTQLFLWVLWLCSQWACQILITQQRNRYNHYWKSLN